MDQVGVSPSQIRDAAIAEAAATLAWDRANPAPTTEDFRLCYLCGMPHLELDLCDTCADACVEDAAQLEHRYSAELVAK